MVTPVVDRPLPPGLVALLARVEDAHFAQRLRAVYEAAARAIGKLGELELIKYEEQADESDGGANLSLWEELAPVVGGTIADVHALITEIGNQFPAGESAVEPRQSQVAAILQKTCDELKAEVGRFGMRVRDPSVVGDRWNLIAELQSFRFQFRNRIGAMVYETASVLGECKRREVEPGYEEALGSTLVVRSTTADLRRLMRARIQKVSEALPEQLVANAQQTEKELNAFGRTAAWRALRAQDKKVILEFRKKLKQVISRPDVTKVDVLEILEPFVEFVDGFAAVNDREILIEHDQEVQASVGVLLERAMNAIAYEEKLAAFNEAVGMGQSLYGRSPALDSFLRKLRKTPLTEQTLPGEIEQFLGLLAGLSQG
jgi:hypothetical protein